MNNELLAALDQLLKTEGTDGVINLLADRIQVSINGAGDNIERVRHEDRVRQLRTITLSAEEALLSV